MHIALKLSDEEQQERELYDIVPTLNAMGYMYDRYSPNVNEYLAAYIAHLKDTDAPVLDIGCAYGVTVLDALQHGAEVVANDMHQPHLDILIENTPDEFKDKLTTNCAHFPEQMNFAENTFSAVLISRVINFLNGEELEAGVEKVYKWLKPGGKVYIIAETVYKKLFEQLITVHDAHIEQGMKWPGHFPNIKPHITHRHDHLPDTLHFYTDRILERTLKKAGFEVEKCHMFSKSTIPEDARKDGKETVGIIGVKPLQS